MKVWASVLTFILLVAVVIASDYGYDHHHKIVVVEKPKIIKVVQPVHVVKVVKHIPPPIPVIKYIKTYHSTSIGHPFHGYHGHGHGHY